MKYLLLTDIPVPWREKVFELIYNQIGSDFHVVYCNYNEDRRLWKFPIGRHQKTFLKSIKTKIREKERNINFEIIPFLLEHRPQVVIWFGFQPTVIFALLISKFIKSKLAVLSDTWLERDKNISWLQKAGRKLAYNYFSDAFIGVSMQTLNMYRFYNKNIKDDALFFSHLCADNDFFIERLELIDINRKYDIMFAGRIEEVKNPIFFSEVAVSIKKLMGKCRVLVIGDGDEKLKKKMFKLLEDNGVEYTFPGFIEHEELPDYYSQAKIFLFPTSGDCWGVVINEAMISGMPVITTNMTAAADELVLNGKNGYILPMKSNLWAEKAISLLENSQKWKTYSECAKRTVSKFNFEEAAEGIISAIDYLDSKEKLDNLRKIS